MIKYDVEKLIEEVITFDHIKIETVNFTIENTEST